MPTVPFNRPYITGNESQCVARALADRKLGGDGAFSGMCHSWLESRTGCTRALLTPSCTAALEMMTLLLDLQPGDEVIMPSFSFVSPANAVVLRGAVPVFVDIRSDTLNINECLVEAAITSRTRAILVVHYAGISCEMDAITRLASEHGLAVIEDAAHGLLSSYKGRHLGTIGSLGALSFHETKNVTSGEGGALLVNDPSYVGRAEVIRDKGTNRRAFFNRQVDRYRWVDVGSSYLSGEPMAAFLCAQLDEADSITRRRLDLWNRYHAWAAPLEHQGLVRRPIVPHGCHHNGHIYYLLLPDHDTRAHFIHVLAKSDIETAFHYAPLHSSPAGILYGRTSGSMRVTDDVADRLVRLPLWPGLEEYFQDVVAAASRALGRPEAVQGLPE